MEECDVQIFQVGSGLFDLKNSIQGIHFTENRILTYAVSYMIGLIRRFMTLKNRTWIFIKY